jgi:serine/threonine-protein kinase RsbW
MRNPASSPAADARPEVPADQHVVADPHPAVVPPTPLRMRVESDPANLSKVRLAVEAYAAAAGFGAEAVAELGLVVNEAMANVIRHAYQGRPGQPIEVEAEPTGDGGPADLRVRLRDWGIGVDPRTTAKRGYIPGEPGGLGLVCLKQMMDDVQYAPQPGGGMLLTMVKRRV